MSGVRAAKKKETRRAIMQAAVELFAEKGFEGTSIEDLARAAGVGKGTVYGYFQDKNEIFLAFCEEELDYTFGVLSEKTDPDASLIEQLMTLFMTQFHVVTENREFGRHLIREMAFPRAGDAHKSKDLDARYLEAVGAILDRAQKRGELREGYDPFLATAHFYSLYLIALSGFYSGYVSTIEEVEASLRELIRQTIEGLGQIEVTR